MSESTQNKLVPGPRYHGADYPETLYALFDVDATLVKADSPDLPSDRFFEAARNAEQRASVGLITARGMPKASYILEKGRFKGISILGNGSQLWQGEMLVERPLALEPTMEIVRTLQAMNVEHWVQDNGYDRFWGGRAA